MTIQPDSEVAGLLEQHADDIAGAASRKLLEDHPEAGERLGKDAYGIWSGHLKQRVLELCAALSAGKVNLFISRVAWSRAAMNARHVNSDDLQSSLSSLRAVIQTYVSGTARQAVDECIDTAIATIQRTKENPETCTLDPGLMPQRIALRYIKAVISGNAIPGMAIVLDAVDGGLSVQDAMLKILMPAQREVGRLWHMNEISVAEEHMVTMTTQRLMAVLASLASYKPDSGRTVVAAAVTSNIHDIAIRSIAYLIEIQGWRTIYLGSDVPMSDIPAAIECFEADLVMLSIALSSQLPVLQHTIEKIRKELGQEVKIMVGGNGLDGAPELWKELGADGYEETAESALIAANELVPIE